MNTTIKKITLIAALFTTNLSGFVYGPLYAEARPGVAPHTVSMTETTIVSEKSDFESTAEEFVLLQDFQGLFELTTKEIEKDPTNATAFYYRAGSRFYLDHDLALVRADLDQAISLRPQFVDALMARAFVFETTDDFASAIKDYSTVLSFEPENQDALFARMSAHEYIQDWKGFLADCNIWIQLSPDNSYAYYTRAMTHKELGDTASAIADLQKASEILIAQNRNEESKEILAVIAELKKEEGVG